jgi:ribosomal-protein-serine acetyltransferase
MFRAILRPDLELRLLEERHAAELFAAVHRNRDHLRQWLPWVDSTRSEDDSASFLRAALERFASKGEITAGIWHQEKLCGVIGAHKTDRLNRLVELGYWLDKERQGRGIMTDACRALTGYCLTETDLNRVEIRCGTGNAKSCAIPRRLGFTYEATLREAEYLNGEYHDLQLWSMLRREFAQVQPRAV